MCGFRQKELPYRHSRDANFLQVTLCEGQEDAEVNILLLKHLQVLQAPNLLKECCKVLQHIQNKLYSHKQNHNLTSNTSLCCCYIFPSPSNNLDFSSLTALLYSHRTRGLPCTLQTSHLITSAQKTDQSTLTIGPITAPKGSGILFQATLTSKLAVLHTRNHSFTSIYTWVVVWHQKLWCQLSSYLRRPEKQLGQPQRNPLSLTQ